MPDTRQLCDILKSCKLLCLRQNSFVFGLYSFLVSYPDDSLSMRQSHHMIKNAIIGNWAIWLAREHSSVKRHFRTKNLAAYCGLQSSCNQKRSREQWYYYCSRDRFWLQELCKPQYCGLQVRCQWRKRVNIELANQKQEAMSFLESDWPIWY